MHLNKANRLIHRWATVVVAGPILVMILTGMMLQWKKQFAWMQPPTQRGVATAPLLGFGEILSSAVAVEEAGIDSWGDIDRLDVRPDKGIVKVRARSGWEVQIDTSTGDVLQTAYRRSDLIESLHDGSYFHSATTLWVFFPAAVALLLMWGTGIYMFLLPYIARRKRRARARATIRESAEPAER
ncbi:MAG: PepSY domain-containing protein [Phycisphaeraceae bacterium]